MYWVIQEKENRWIQLLAPVVSLAVLEVCWIAFAGRTILPPVLREVDGRQPSDEPPETKDDDDDDNKFLCSSHSWCLQCHTDESHCTVFGNFALASDGTPYRLAKAFLR